jgi:hypothetical protein
MRGATGARWHPGRRPSQKRQVWVPSAESVRISVCRPRPGVWGVERGRVGCFRCDRSRCWSARCRAAVARPPVPRTGLPVVNERDERVMAEDLLPRWSSVPLLGARRHQHSVDIHDHRTVGGRGIRPGQQSYSGSYLRSCRADRRQSLRPVRGVGADQAGEGWIGGHQPEHPRLGP